MAKPITKNPAPQQVNKWDEELAKFAQETSAAEQVSGSFLSFKSGMLSFNGAAIPGNKLNVVILDYMHENHFYKDAYDADNPAAPVCFSFGRDTDAMVPHETSYAPQSDRCSSCPNNVFGSDGRGKACKNVRRMAIIPADGLDNVSEAELAFVKLPVTSGKNFTNYIKQVADVLKRPPFAVITEISVVPDMKTQFKVNFRHVGSITDGEQLQGIMDRRANLESSLAVPYTYTPPEEKPVAAPSRASAKVKGKR